MSCCWWRHDPVRLTLYLSPFFLPIKAVPVNIHPKANKSNPCYALHTTRPHKTQPLPLKLPWATLLLVQSQSTVLWTVLLGTVGLGFAGLKLSTYGSSDFTSTLRSAVVTLCRTVTCLKRSGALYSAHLLTSLLTSRCRVLLEKLTGLQLVKKFPAFHVTRRFITALTSVRHLSLSWASPIQSTYTHPISWRSILILSTHLRLDLPSGLLPSGLPTKTL